MTLPETSYSQSGATDFEGKFLTPHLWWVLGGDPPNAGYAIGSNHRLYRNGQAVGSVRLLEWDREVGSWWVHYTARRGGPMDHA